jgi:lipopolysaccharide/colanic/teichoic acid biosynthesis glycosyltransferase
MNENDLNNNIENNTVQANNPVINEPTQVQNVQSVKKKKYWLIPVIDVIVLIVSLIFIFLPIILAIAFDINTNNIFMSIIRIIMMFLLPLI